LALAANRTGDRALFRKTLADYSKQYKAIAALQAYDRPQSTGGKREGAIRHRGGGGGGSGQTGQLANAAVEQFKNGQYREALATLDKRAAVAKEDQGLGVLRGWALYHLSQYDKARAQFADMDKKRSTRDTQYGLYYSGSKLDPLHLGDE
jgi:tetratricopeptide (TPR) repeat protein